MYFHSLIAMWSWTTYTLSALVSPSKKWWQYLPPRVLVMDKWTSMGKKLNGSWCTVDLQWVLATLVIPAATSSSLITHVPLTLLTSFSLLSALSCAALGRLSIVFQPKLTLLQAGDGSLNLELKWSGLIQMVDSLFRWWGASSTTSFNKRAEHLL